MEACSSLRVNQAFTSYNHPKGDADTEPMMRTLKEELLWLREWPSANELTKGLDQWIAYNNQSYLHSALGYRLPNQADETCDLSRKTLLKSA